MISGFRWFGPSDVVSLADIKQSGATQVVTALHDVANGKLWTVEAVAKHKRIIEEAGLHWEIVESLPIHESIKLRAPGFEQYIEVYQNSMRSLAHNGIKTICYNFMPVLDWTRTQLFWELDNGATALRFDKVEMCVFEKYILKRTGCEADYTKEVVEEADQFYRQASKEELQQLQDNVLKGLPGTVDDLDIPTFKKMLSAYDGIDEKTLKSNLKQFLQAVVPLAEKLGMRFAIHPDDPPMNILGLPRIIKNEKDLEDLVGFVNSPANGITFCTGSLGVNEENDLPKMIKKFAERIHFYHLRNVRREANGSFYEDQHLEGSTDMVEVVKTIVERELETKEEIIMRPDHGHQMLADLKDQSAYAGYAAIGRMKGLAEIKGVERAVKSYYGIK